MGTPGVPWKMAKSRILEVIKKKKGVVAQICKELDIAFETYVKHIKNKEEFKEAIDNARNDYDTTIADMAENALMRGLQDEDPNAYLKSAMYVLNNKGRDRGYNHPEAQKQVFTLVEVKEKLKDGKLVQS